jgi:hypothetical protein
LDWVPLLLAGLQRATLYMLEELNKLKDSASNRNDLHVEVRCFLAPSCHLQLLLPHSPPPTAY